MEINYLAVLVCGVLAMAIGSVWYGPLFGKKWMQIVGATPEDMAKRKEMQKAAMPLYVVQFLLSLLQLYVLANLLVWGGWSEHSVWVSFFVWLGFIMPTVAGSAMWNNDASKIKWAKFFIQSGCQLVTLLVFGLVLGMWR